VVQAFSTGQTWNKYAQLMEDVITINLQSFLVHVVQFVSINVNNVVHALAQLAACQAIDFVWIDECPSLIQHLVSADQGSAA
jgi:hypothetical protein